MRGKSKQKLTWLQETKCKNQIKQGNNNNRELKHKEH